MGRYDVAIIGSGFAGSILARVLRRRGCRVLLLEKGRHPRFALGESTTPLANFALERLAERYGLEDLRQLSSHGRWLAGLPHLRRGLKRGFTFFKHRPGEPYRNSAANEARLLVAASPDDWIADTHWLRSDVDHHLVERAIEEGVEVRQGTEVVAVEMGKDGVRLEVTGEEGRQTFEADTVVDGSGPRGVLAQSLPIAHGASPVLNTSLLYGHFEEVRPFREVAEQLTEGPYPDDAAAVHHLLAEGWMYVLPFDHGVVSAGMVLRRDAFDEETSPEELFRTILERYPSLAASFAAARPVVAVRCVPHLPYRLSQAAGPRWFLLPHSFAFYDPLFSTGMAWSLLAVERLAQILEGRHGSASAYHDLLKREACQMAHLMEAAHLAMGDFRCFTAVCGLYFATVSYAEARQRLLDRRDGEPPRAWQGFLGAEDVQLQRLYQNTRRTLRRFSSRPPSPEELDAFTQRLGRSVEPYDLVGLDVEGRHNLHPVDLDLLRARGHLIGLRDSEMEGALEKLRGAYR